MSCALPPQPPDQFTKVDDEKGVNWVWHKWFLDMWRLGACLNGGGSPVIAPTGGTGGSPGPPGPAGPAGPAGPTGADGPMVPYFIAASETFNVPLYKQALYAMTIDNEGSIVLDGYLVLVD